jgi:Cu(I)/Ag(I) efflux system membrane fusion protein
MMKKYLILLIIVFISACSSKKKQASSDTDVYYTCSMHPQIMEPKPGKCPICGMELISVQKSKGPSPDEIQLSDQQVQLGNVHTDTIQNGVLGDQLVLTATLNFDQMKAIAISSRVMGRIERLYFKNIGDYVNKDDKLFDLYSEEFNSAKQEYLSALERQKILDNSVIDFNQIIQSAKNKLLLWGMSEAQIEELTKTKNAKATTSFYSNASGYITEIDIKEGDYVMEGGTITRLANLSTLWAEAQVYTSQLSQLDRNGIAVVQIPDMPEKELKGNIEFVNPEINLDTRINLVRVTIPNVGNKLRPGMPAYVIIKSRQKNVLVLPIDAVIRDGKGATVWLQTGHNVFKSKMVIVGLETEGQIEITSGLKVGDIVVTSGAYLLNSEYIFKKGANPMAGHDMSKM